MTINWIIPSRSEQSKDRTPFLNLWWDYNERNWIHRQDLATINPSRTISYPDSWTYPNSFTDTPCNFSWADPCVRTNPNGCAHSQPDYDPWPISEVALEIPWGGRYSIQKIFSSATCFSYPEPFSTWPDPAEHPCSSSIPTGYPITP